jgi:hypothetical protein
VLTDVTSEIESAGTVPEETERTRGLSVPLPHKTESYRTEEPQAAKSAPLDKLGLDDRRRFVRESFSGSEPDTVRPAGAHAYVGHEEAIRFGDQKRPRFSKFPGIRKWIAFGALYTVIGVSVSIAGFSILHDGRDIEPTITRVQSNSSSGSEAIAIPGPAADRSEAVVEAQKSQKPVTNADSSQAHEPSRSAEPESAVPGTLQKLAVGVRDPVHEPTPSVAQSLSATPKGSAETAPHSDTGQPPETMPKDEPKATATVPTKNVSAALPSRSYAAERHRASTPRRNAGSRRHIRQRTPTKYP